MGRRNSKGDEGASFWGHYGILTQLGEVYRHCDLMLGGITDRCILPPSWEFLPSSFMGDKPVENEPFGNHIKVRKEWDAIRS